MGGNMPKEVTGMNGKSMETTGQNAEKKWPWDAQPQFFIYTIYSLQWGSEKVTEEGNRMIASQMSGIRAVR